MIQSDYKLFPLITFYQDFVLHDFVLKLNLYLDYSFLMSQTIIAELNITASFIMR